MKSTACLFAIVLSCSLSPASYAAAVSPIPQSQSANGAEREVLESLFDMTGSYYSFPCSADGEVLPITDGELILMEGQIYERWSIVHDGAGNYHSNLAIMPIGLRGTSVETGEEFRVSEENKNIANQRLEGGSGMFRQVIKMVGKETHRQFRLVAAGNYNISSDGVIVTDRFVYSEECR
jgi:hypothetical protein